MLAESGGVGTVSLGWAIPGGAIDLALDPLGAFFLVPIFLLFALGSVYGLAYWPQEKRPGSGRRLRVCRQIPQELRVCQRRDQQVHALQQRLQRLGLRLPRLLAVGDHLLARPGAQIGAPQREPLQMGIRQVGPFTTFPIRLQPRAVIGEDPMQLVPVNIL